MSNSYFRFKQFTIQQDACGMKVSTDACIQGAWTPLNDEVKKILDIGAGTGLLSLMLSQRMGGKAIIDAVEIDAAAAQQAGDNITASIWAEKISMHHADITDFAGSAKYDLIICNPPFFINSLQGSDTRRNTARHNDSLSFDTLFTAIDKFLKPQGYASVLLPVEEFGKWKSVLKAKDWSCFNELWIKPDDTKQYNRVIGLCSRGEHDLLKEELVIYNADRSYTQPFKALFSDFYLAL